MSRGDGDHSECLIGVLKDVGDVYLLYLKNTEAEARGSRDETVRATRVICFLRNQKCERGGLESPSKGPGSQHCLGEGEVLNLRA